MTRRFFYWKPEKGEPVKLVHAIENPLKHLPGKTLTYTTWQELRQQLQQMLRGVKQVAMEYSSEAAIPELGVVDAGTIELIRSLGIEVVSSAPLIQQASVLTQQQMMTHREAAAALDQIAEITFQTIRTGMTDVEVQRFMLEQIQKAGCWTEDPPICAINQDSANPHFSPDPAHPITIQQGDWVLLDLWCKRETPHAIYGDITRVGVLGTPTERQQHVFECVRAAQQAATDKIGEGLPLQGWEADQAARQVIEKGGFSSYFIHRLGHNIHEKDHGPGAHLDNYETHDTRTLLPMTCFSVEPGIYLPGEFGVRLEYDILLHADRSLEITGGIQNSITSIL